MSESFYREWAPARPHVACVWIGHTGGDGGDIDRILPDACIDVIWNGEELFVAGPDTGPVVFEPVIGRTNIGVRFRPGRANAFLGVAAGDIRDQRVDVAGLLGESVAARIIDAVVGAPDPARALEAAVSSDGHDGSDALVDAVVAGMRDASGRGAVDTLARDVGVHPRSLHRRCVDAFGYGPKTLQRILRFQRFLSNAAGSDVDLAALAVTTGYSDQAHMTRDCRELSGLTPAALLAGRARILSDPYKTAKVTSRHTDAMDIKFVAGFAPVVRDLPASVALYRDAFGLPLESDTPDYYATNSLDGVKHFGLWRLEDAAQSCFGTNEWPGSMPIPQATIEFEVDDVAASAAELEAAGYTLVHGERTEPWGQVIARLVGPEGLLLGLTNTASMH